MRSFSEIIIKPYIIENKYKKILEIGVSRGDTTDRLLSINIGSVTLVDPCLDENLHTKYGKDKRVNVFKGLSLEILPKISGKFDCILIDGDHNWYTVINELRTIHKRGLLEAGGTIFFHDVCWPYGRRDMYYLPESIPEEYRHPYARKNLKCNRSDLVTTVTPDKCNNNAIHEGGPRNGVLTAIEDFLKEHEKDYLFFIYKKQYGLGILTKKKNMNTRIKYFKWLTKLNFMNVL